MNATIPASGAALASTGLVCTGLTVGAALLPRLIGVALLALARRNSKAHL
jgi:hypothetical protein